MSQLVLILGIIGLIFFYFLYKRKAISPKEGSEEMVKCITCGVNIPKSKAFKSGEKWFCSKEHKN